MTTPTAQAPQTLAQFVAELSGPGFRRGSTNPSRDGSSWSFYLEESGRHRDRLIDRARLTDDELATAAARFGIVAGPIPRNTGGDESYAFRMHASVAMWSAIHARVEKSHQMLGFRGFRAWPGDIQADYDASAERFNLGPSGPWDGWPPIYTEGALQRPDLLP